MAAYHADRAGEASRVHEAVMAALDLAAPGAPCALSYMVRSRFVTC